MNEYPKTEEELISGWLDLAGGEWGGYGWVGPATWGELYRDSAREDLFEKEDGTFKNSWGARGDLGEHVWIRPRPFSIRILLNPFAEEGRVYLAHAGTKYLEYTDL